MRLPLLLAILALVPLAAEQVAVLLDDGSRIEGELISRDETQIVLKVTIPGRQGKASHAQVCYQMEHVREILAAQTAEERYVPQAAQVPDRPLEQLGLATWCRENNLPGHAATHAKRAFELDPGNARALELLAQLGWQRDGDTWISEADYLAKTGQVKVGGKIMTPADAEAAKADAAADVAANTAQGAFNAARGRAERAARKLTDADAALAKARKTSEELAKLEADGKAAGERTAAAEREVQAAEERIANEKRQSQGVIAKDGKSSEEARRALSDAQDRLAKAQREATTAKRGASNLTARKQQAVKRIAELEAARTAAEQEKAEADQAATAAKAEADLAAAASAPKP